MRFQVLFSDGSSKTLQKTFCKKNGVENLLQKVRPKKISNLFSRVFWAFLDEKKNTIKNINNKNLTLVLFRTPTHPPTTGVPGYFVLAAPCRLSASLPMTASGQPVQTSFLKTWPLGVRSFFRSTRCRSSRLCLLEPAVAAETGSVPSRPAPSTACLVLSYTRHWLGECPALGGGPVLPHHAHHPNICPEGPWLVGPGEPSIACASAYAARSRALLSRMFPTFFLPERAGDPQNSGLAQELSTSIAGTMSGNPQLALSTS
jgi:hypothetical protein